MNDWIRWGLRLSLAVALVYVAFVFYHRRESTQRLAEQKAAVERERVEGDLERAGGSSLKITQFYTSPTAIASGESAQLCYGVVFAEKLQLRANPPGDKLDDVWPSLQRCIDVKPKTSTEYTLTATDKAGASATQNAKVEIR